MIVTCEGCETSFHVQDQKIKATGSKVRCSKCRHVFVAYPTAAVEPDETFIMQATVPAAAVAEDPARLNEIDFKLDAARHEDTAAKTDAISIDPEPEFLDVGDLLAEEAPAAGEPAADRLGDDLKLDLDLGLDLEGTLEEGAAEAKATRPAKPEEAFIDFNLGSESDISDALEDPFPSLDELEISLDDLDPLEATRQPGAREAARPQDIPDAQFELDLDLETLDSESDDAVPGVATAAGIGALVDSVDTPRKEHAVPAAEPMDAPELELDLNLDETTVHLREEALPAPAGEDELDLSDLEAMLEGVEKGTALKPAATEEIDLELDLQAVVPAEAPRDAMQELDLTAIAGPSEESAANVDAAAEALDFSDLAGILDEKAQAAGSADTQEAAEGIDLIFEEQPLAEPAEAAPQPSSEIEDGLMLDIERLLEEDAEKKPATEAIDVQATDEMDLSLETESVRDAAGEPEIEIELVADSDDFEDDQPSTAATPAAVAAAAAASTAAIAAGSLTAPAASDDSFTDEFAPAVGATDALETEAAQTDVPADQKAKAAVRTGGIRKLLLAAAAILLLAIAGLAVSSGLGIQLPFLKDVEIPFIGKIFQAEPEDTLGNLKVMVLPESVSAEFIESVRAGRICVIQGQVRNNYDHPRSFIRLTGKLYDKNKNVVKMASVFAGNSLSKDELASQDFGAISAYLQNKKGANNLNVGVKPGASIPFLVVFDGLPENLDEYSVEVAGSSN